MVIFKGFPIIFIRKKIETVIITVVLFGIATNVYAMPTQDQVGGLTQFSNFLVHKSISSLTLLYSIFSGDKKISVLPGNALESGSGVIKAAATTFEIHDPNSWVGPDQNHVRYLYSSRWGWLDMKHFAAAALETSKHGSLLTSVLGTLLEIRQAATDPTSSFSYEDEVSNELGEYFYSKYSQTDENKNLPFKIRLNEYLTELGIVEHPETSAPNYSQLPQNEAEVGKIKTIRDFSYQPVYTTTEKNDELDEKIIEFERWGF